MNEWKGLLSGNVLLKWSGTGTKKNFATGSAARSRAICLDRLQQ
jgi:hypothetical protein